MEVPEIDVAELSLRHAAGALVIDVREDHEYAEGHVPGARHIPLGEVPERVNEVPTDGPVYIICALGGRSLSAAEHLRAQGLDAVNVAGGTLAWMEAGQPTDKGAGSEAGAG